MTSEIWKAILKLGQLVVVLSTVQSLTDHVRSPISKARVFIHTPLIVLIFLIHDEHIKSFLIK